jgi:hypothetical protein
MGTCRFPVTRYFQKTQHFGCTRIENFRRFAATCSNLAASSARTRQSPQLTPDAEVHPGRAAQLLQNSAVWARIRLSPQFGAGPSAELQELCNGAAA